MTAADAYAYFTDRAAKMVLAQNKRPIQWSEVYDNFGTKLNKNIIIHIWKSNTNVSEVVENGYNVLLNVRLTMPRVGIWIIP
eukprot:UN04236